NAPDTFARVLDVQVPSQSFSGKALGSTPFSLDLTPTFVGAPPYFGMPSGPQLPFKKLFTFWRDESMNLIIPVEGIRPEDLRDTFNASRSEGRVHHAIDIMAPLETPVLAAADGEILRLSYNKRGGNTIYQLSSDKKTVFYYAHLDS